MMNKKCLSCVHCEVCSFIDSDTAKLEACDFYTEGCEDAISRQAVKELFQEACEMKMYDFLGIEDLPSVTSEPKTGHWIWCVGSHKCSNCEEYTCFSHKTPLRYCPNCGAKMIDPQESEVNNG